MPDCFQNVSERKKERGDTDSEDFSGGSNQGDKQASIDEIAERLAQKRAARKNAEKISPKNLIESRNSDMWTKNNKRCKKTYYGLFLIQRKLDAY